MADLIELKQIAEQAARRGLDPIPVAEVRIHPSVGMDGEDVLRVTVVIADDRFAEVDGEHFLNGIVNVRQDVRLTGELRETLVEYQTVTGPDDDGGR
jgi:hypothetical protein